MKKIMYLIVFSTLIGCSSSGKFGNLTTDNISVDPKVLELKGGQVPVTVTGTFPAKFFPKEGELEFTPVVETPKNNIQGDKVIFYGEKVKDAGLLIVSNEYGGTFSETQSFSYTEDMKMSELYAEFKVKKGDKDIKFGKIKLADGVITTPLLLDVSEATVTSKEVYGVNSSFIGPKSGTIQYVIEKSDIRKTELSKSEIQNLVNALKSAGKGSYIHIVSAASPDGTEGLNSNLAKERDREATKFITGELKKLKIDLPVKHTVIAEDWEGLYEKMETSGLKNKDQMIQSLKAEKNVKRRQDILQGYINNNGLFEGSLLPPLRRSEIMLHTDGEKMTSTTAKIMMEKDPSQMSLNDRLSATAEMTDTNKKIDSYKAIIQKYPEDWRAFNNLAAIYIQQKKWNDATPLINQSVKLNENPENKYNQGLIQLSKGNMTGAKSSFSSMPVSSERNSSQWNNADGAVEIFNGNYSQAVSIYGNTISNNAALAQLLNKDYSKASATLSKISSPNATTYYLKAIVGARTDNKNMVYDNLKEVMSKDRTLGQSAKTDIEFAKYMKDSQFTGILQ